MSTFHSWEDYHRTVKALMGALESDGHHEAVAELKSGYQCVNGLTDGWAQFLEALDRVWKTWSAGFRLEDRKTLEAIRKATRRAVYRR
jgi:hypothetical protein